MASAFYPDTKRLFESVSAGRKLRYTPAQIIEEFRLYIEDLKQNPIEVETDYKRQAEQGGRVQQRRVTKYNRPPKVLDFITRWLGQSHQWWYALPKGKHGATYQQVQERIEQYCRDVKFDGAVVGIYNANIIARDLGLTEKVELKKRDDAEEMSLDEINEEIARLNKLEKENEYETATSATSSSAAGEAEDESSDE